MLLGVIYLRLFVRLILSTSLSFESFCFLWPKLAKAKVKVFHIICNLYFSNAYGDNDGNDHQNFDDSNYATVEHDDHHDKWSNLANHHDHTQDQYDNGANQYHEGLVDQNHQEPIYSVTKSHNDGDNCDHAKLGELVHTPIASAPSSSLLFENRLFSPQSNAHRCPQPNLMMTMMWYDDNDVMWWQW